MGRDSQLMENRRVRGLVVGGAAAAAAVLLLLTGALDGPERTSWDWRVRTLARASVATDDVVLLLIDQASIDELIDQFGVDWPWPRSVQSYLLQFASLSGAASVSYDLILQDGLVGPADNAEFAAAAGRIDRFVYALYLEQTPAEGNAWPAHVARPPYRVSGVESLGSDRLEQITLNRGVFPHPDVVAPNGRIGGVNGESDADGVFRRYRLYSFHNDQFVPSLALAAYLSTRPADESVRIERGKLVVGDLVIPTDPDGLAVIRYNAAGDDLRTHDEYRAWPVIRSVLLIDEGQEPDVPLDALSGRHVMVGPSAAGLLDLRPTPLEPRAPGVTVHAAMLENLLADEFIREVPSWIAVLLIIALCVAAGLAATAVERTWAEGVLVVGFVVASVALGVGGYIANLWVPMVVPIVGVALALGGANVANYATEGAQKRFLRGAFGQYLSPAVVQQVVDHPERLRLGGERRELTMLFSDIQGFTTLSEGLDPQQLSAFLNIYLTEMVDIIQAEGGTIDKFEGDAIIAFWNAPLELPDHAVRGLRAALNCQERLKALRSEWSRPIAEGGVGRDVFTRIGMNTGEVSVGNFGSQTRFDYTALGDHMNLAARLEGSNKVFGTYLLVSEDTMRASGGAFPARELGRIAVVGRSEPVTVFEPMLEEGYRARATALETYANALRAWYDARFDDALALFASIADADAPARRMHAMCADWVKRSGELPAQWTGVVTLTEK